MTPKQALAFVKNSGIVLESARGTVPNLAEVIAGERIRGSWWSHTKAQTIFRCSRAIRESEDVLVCRLVDGKVTYVHRRLWPALVRLSKRFESQQLAAIREVHGADGQHNITITPFPRWVPDDVMKESKILTDKAAESKLAILFDS